MRAIHLDSVWVKFNGRSLQFLVTDEELGNLLKWSVRPRVKIFIVVLMTHSLLIAGLLTVNIILRRIHTSLV